MATEAKSALSSGRVLLLAVTCGALIANLYFVQPIAQIVANSLHLPLQQAGLLSMLPLLGYGAGLLLVVPLGDLAENRRLILIMTAAEALSMLLLWWVGQPWSFLAISFVSGLAATGIQVILPYTSTFFSGARQGREVARLVSGVMLGIMIARPFSSFVAGALPWRTVYLIGAATMAVLTGVLFPLLPARKPPGRENYVKLIGSMGRILRESAVLRRRALYQSAMFGAFLSFWTPVPLWLAGAPFHLSQRGIAWVALAGVAGAFAPPIATRLVDAGHTRVATMTAFGLVIVAFLVTLLARSGSVPLVVAAGVVLDGAVSACLVIGQRTIYALGAEQRGRMNALFMGAFFTAGSLASASAAFLFVHFGWIGNVVQGIALPAAALAYSFTEGRSASAAKTARAS